VSKSLKKSPFGYVILLYGIVGFLLASNTIDIQPMGLINIPAPSSVVRPIYAFFNPLGFMFPYIGAGLPLETWNFFVLFINFGFPILMIVIGLMVIVKPRMKIANI